MKNTIKMITFMGTIMLTWMGIAFIGYMLTNGNEFKDCMVTDATLFIMLIAGWLPAVIVIADLDSYLNKQAHGVYCYIFSIH